MPYGKGNQSTRKNPREEANKEEDSELEVELDPIAREDTLSPLYSASSSAGSVASGGSGSTVSPEQLQMILAANNKSMETSILSIISTMTPSAGSVAPTPAVASRPAVTPVKVPKWTDGDQAFSFFTKLETALTHNMVDKATWGRLLPVYLSGRAETAFAQVDRAKLGDYDTVKSVLLKALGDTPAHADRNWWSLSRLSGETPADFYLRIRNTGLRRLTQLPTREDVVEHMILSRFLSLLPADSYTAVTSQHPKSGLEAAELLQDFEESRAYAWKRQNWKNTHHSGRREHSRGSGNHGSSHDGRHSSPSKSGSSPTRSTSNSGTGVSDDNVQSNSGAPAHNKGSGRRPIICHNCGEPGHIKPNCPHRIRRVKAPDPSPVYFVDGLINGCKAPGLSVDTGADRTLVREDYIPDGAYTGDTVILDSWRGAEVSQHKLALVTLEVEGVSVEAKVAVVADLEYPALLGKDLGRKMSRKLLSLVLKNMDDSDSDDSEVPKQSDSSVVTKQEVKSEVVRVTRAQAEKARKEDVANDLASANSGCDPLALEDIFGFEDAFFDDDVCDEVPMQFVSSVNIVVPMQSDCSVNIEVPMQFDSSVNIVVPMQSDSSVNIEVPMQMEPEVACEAPPVVLEDIFCFDDSLFEPEDACDAPAVVVDDIFGLTVFPCEPMEASVASVVALEDISWPDLSDVDDEVLEVLEASVAPNIVVPEHLEVVHDEVLEAGVAGVASVDSVEIVVPMQVVVNVDVAVDWVAPADVVSDAVSATVGDYFYPPVEFFVEDQADVVASGPVVCKPMVGLDVAVFVDSLSATDPVLAPVPVARPESETVVNFVILAMEDSIPSKLCWRSPTVLVDHCLRCSYCVSKATGKFAPGSCTVILMFDVFILVISTICSFCSCISVCLSKLLVVLFFGAFGPRTETPGKSAPEKVAWSEALVRNFIFLKNCIYSAPCLTLPVVGDVFILQSDTSSLPVSPTDVGGGDVMESPSLVAAAHNI